MKNEKFDVAPAGFWAGLWHGFISLFTFIISYSLLLIKKLPGHAEFECSILHGIMRNRVVSVISKEGSNVTVFKE
jgi:hypothetical protein